MNVRSNRNDCLILDSVNFRDETIERISKPVWHTNGGRQSPMALLLLQHAMQFTFMGTSMTQFNMLALFTAAMELPSSRGDRFLVIFVEFFLKVSSCLTLAFHFRGLPFSEPPTVKFSTHCAKLKV